MLRMIAFRVRASSPWHPSSRLQAHCSYFAEISGTQPGDPKKAARVIIDVVRQEGAAAGREIPSVIVLGSDGYSIVRTVCEETIKRLESWKDVSCSTDLPK